ncbi:MAG TPA: hypothetical protein PKC20_13825 [Burkholderiaceae bacterium]|nr:hypothetical protein [Burkholderiaceae bacterium]
MREAARSGRRVLALPKHADPLRDALRTRAPLGLAIGAERVRPAPAFGQHVALDDPADGFGRPVALHCPRRLDRLLGLAALQQEDRDVPLQDRLGRVDRQRLAQHGDGPVVSAGGRVDSGEPHAWRHEPRFVGREPLQRVDRRVRLAGGELRDT